MLLFIVILWALCVGDFVHCEGDTEPEYIGYDAGLGKNKLNFGYGVNFKNNGKVQNNLDRVWIVQRFNLPQELNFNFKGINFGLNCTYERYSEDLKSNLIYMSRLYFIKDICKQTQPMLRSMFHGALQYNKILKKLIKDDLYHALHSLSAVEELRFKRHVKLNTTNSPTALQADSRKSSNNSFTSGRAARNKRGFLPFLPLIGKIATIAIEALGSHLQRKRQRAMIKAVNHLQSRQFLTRNQLYT